MLLIDCYQKAGAIVVMCVQLKQKTEGGNEMKNLSELSLNELSGTELVTVMNEVMAEVKSRLDEGTVTKYVAREIPSTVVEAETVEHDGKLLREVDRKSKSGDFVRFSGLSATNTKNGIFYEVVSGNRYTVPGRGEGLVYGWIGKPNPEIFEVVGTMEEIKKQLGIVSPSEYYFKRKSPNQQRAELIQRAREFVDEQNNSYVEGCCIYEGNTCLPVFIINVEKRTVVCLLKGNTSGTIYTRGIAKCMPGDIFNESIGKAIALAKALKIAIPQEFIDAVQPDEKVIGMVVQTEFSGLRTLVSSLKGGMCNVGDCLLTSQNGIESIIYNDTNAEYQFESVGE